jgi:hypothetical protein
MAPPLRINWQPPTAPLDPTEIASAFEGYQQTIQTMPRDQLLAELARVSALLESQSSNLLTSQLWQASHSAIDRLDQAQEPMSMTMDSSRFGADPERPASRPSPEPSRAISLLAGTGRLGPRLAAKLVVSSARAQTRRNGGY